MPMILNSIFSLTMKSVETNAKISIENARQAFADAETEMKFGDLAANMMDKHTGASSENLSEIACWHYDRSVKQFRKAMGKFEIAGRYSLPTKYAKYVENKKAACVARANEAFGKRNSPKLNENN